MLTQLVHGARVHGVNGDNRLIIRCRVRQSLHYSVYLHATQKTRNRVFIVVCVGVGWGGIKPC